MAPSPSGGITCPSCGVNLRRESLPGSRSHLGETSESVVPAAAPPEQPPRSPLPTEKMSLPFSPRFLSQYRFVRKLGEGAMGAVYLMHQLKLDRLVAVKTVRGEEVTTNQVARLLKEAKVVAGLNHAGIVAVHDADVDGSTAYIVCEFVEGLSLADRLKSPPVLSLRQILVITIQVLDGLRVAHDKGVIHRDLKPGNIFLTRDGKPKIGDFGLAKSHNLPSGTSVGRIMGTPRYMSPEQCRGAACTPASDLYSVGVILFEMMTGQPPFPGPSVPEYLYQHVRNVAPLASSIQSNIPRELDGVLSQALDKDPRRRFQGAFAFQKALTEVYRGLTPASTVATPPKGGPSRPVSSGVAPGFVLSGRYELVRMLGQGGMGQVWLAKDLAMEDGAIAIKLLPPELSRDVESRANLVREARLSLKLSHPNIVRLINLEPGDPPYLVMEHVQGRTLADELAARQESETGPMSPREALPIIRDVAAALDHAHSLKVIHRDLKPSNVLLMETEPDRTTRAKLADFGIAAELTSFRSRQTGVVPVGTLAYMSPEQVACQKLDERSDVYSLGATLYKMLVLSEPFAGGDLAWAIQSAPVPVPDGLPEPILRVLLRALAKKPSDRPRSAGELAEEFSASLDEALRTTITGPPPAEASSPPEPTKPAIAAGRLANGVKEIDEVGTRTALETEAAGKVRGAGAPVEPSSPASVTSDGTSWSATRGSPQGGAWKGVVGAGLGLATIAWALGSFGPGAVILDESDGRPGRRKPVSIERVLPDTHSSPLRVAGRGESTAAAYLGSLKIVSVPAGAEVLAEPSGSVRGKTPLFLAGLVPGIYPYRLRLAGYDDSTVEAFVQAGRTVLASAFLVDSNKARTPSAALSPVDPKGKAERLTTARFPPDDEEMVLVPAGEFRMGSSDGGVDEKPVHDVHVDAFYMDKHEVTNRRFRKFVEACRYRRAEFADDPRFNADEQPVVGVSSHAAAAFCLWAGKRLPTEAEWEKAARAGLEGKKYPWGDEAPKGRACFAEGLQGQPKPVGSYEPNRLGIFDIGGNVWEWCSDWYEEDYYKRSLPRNPVGPPTAAARAVRGGAWLNDGLYVRCAARDKIEPAKSFNNLGFRCVTTVSHRVWWQQQQRDAQELDVWQREQDAARRTADLQPQKNRSAWEIKRKRQERQQLDQQRAAETERKREQDQQLQEQRNAEHKQRKLEARRRKDQLLEEEKRRRWMEDAMRGVGKARPLPTPGIQSPR